MSGFIGGAAACLLVRVSSETATGLHRHCPRCKTRRSFVSSGKFRVNAQKKRIDVWLIFRCSQCDDRWNWPIHERRSVGALDPAELEALAQNDPGLAAHHARIAMRQNGTETDPGSGAAVTRSMLKPLTDNTQRIEIEIAVDGARVRLDRILAQALSLGRSEVHTLVTDIAGKALRRPAIDGQRIIIRLAECTELMAGRLREALRDDG